MRELVLKNLTSGDRKKREIFLSESYEKEGCQQKLEKRSICIIKDVIPITESFDVELYLDRKRQEGRLAPKQTFIVRDFDSKKCQDKFTYKILGDAYTILDNKLFVIKLIQHIKLEFTKADK